MSLRRTLILLTCCLLFLPATAMGQADFGLSQLSVSFWPEFDRPQVLVIYRAELPQDLTLPAVVELPLPQQVEAPHAVANATDTGSLVNASYDLVPSGDGQVLQVTAETRTVWVEYYQALDINGNQRNFEYQWPGPMAVEAFSFEVQQPVGARSLEVDPPADSQRVGSDGLTYLTGSLGAVESGESVSLEFSYLKDSNELTAGQQPQPPLEGVSTEAPSRQTGVGWLTGALFGLGLALVIAGGYWLWRRQRPTGARKKRRRSRPKKKIQPRFCHQCGQEVSAEDRYCRHCGAEQRAR